MDGNEIVRESKKGSDFKNEQIGKVFTNNIYWFYECLPRIASSSLTPLHSLSNYLAGENWRIFCHYNSRRSFLRKVQISKYLISFGFYCYYYFFSNFSSLTVRYCCAVKYTLTLSWSIKTCYYDRTTGKMCLTSTILVSYVNPKYGLKPSVIFWRCFAVKITWAIVSKSFSLKKRTRAGISFGRTRLKKRFCGK